MLSAKLKEAAGNGADATLYVNDVFSTYLYNGGLPPKTITNDIDLAGKGGLTWIKSRNLADSHRLVDTVRGVTKALYSNTTAAQVTEAAGLTAFTSSGFTVDYDSGYCGNTSTDTYASWTFRKAAKFFDVVTYTGTGSARTIAHSLGVAPGMIIVKRTDASANWQVYHRSLTSAAYSIQLNLTNAQASAPTVWNSTAPTSSVFSVGTDATVNASGGTYVAYLFAHDTSSTGIIQCGSLTTDASGNVGSVSLGYEPAFIMVKRTDNIQNWYTFDTMRGMSLTNSKSLSPNLSDAELDWGASSYIYPTATGFAGSGNLFGTNANLIYMAIRMPNKPPTSGTQVFGLNARTGTGANATVTGGQTDDAVLIKNRGSAIGDLFASRLTGTRYLETSSTAAEVAAGTTILQANPWDVMDGVKVGTTSTITNASANTFINYLFKRAPGFFDVVCYTGTTPAQTLNHNLNAVPELMIIKRRLYADNWPVYSATLGNQTRLKLNATDAQYAPPTSVFWNSTTPTSTTFTVGTFSEMNGAGNTFVAYLFATLAGISKVGSYTGNGSTGQVIACGFSGGARFVLIKRTDAAGAWYTFDSARGLTSGSSPYLLLNSTAAEVTGNNGVYASTGGFTLGATASTTTNINGASYIYLSVA